MRGNKNSDLKLDAFLRGLKANGQNLTAIAARAKIPRSTMSAWSAGQMPTDLSALKRLAQITGHSMHFILWGCEDEMAQVKAVREQIILDELFSGKFEIQINLKKIIEKKREE
jgi:transcriptional regulator with XRE-family HTH domain